MDISFYLAEEHIDNTIKAIKNHIDENDGSDYHYWLTFVPSFSPEFYERKLMPFLSEIPHRIHPTCLVITMVPLERDVLTMEMHHDTRKLKLEEKESVVADIVFNAVDQIDRLFGAAMNTAAKGDCACIVHNRLETARSDRLRFEAARGLVHASKIGHLIMLDRSCDMVTPMIMQATYAGLVDELFDSTEHVLQCIGWQKPTPFCFNSNDYIWAELRDLHILDVGPKLKTFLAERDHILQEVKKLQEDCDNINAAPADPAHVKWLKQQAEDLESKMPLMDCHAKLFDYIQSQLLFPTMNLQFYQSKYMSGYCDMITRFSPWAEHEQVNLYEERCLFPIKTFVRGCAYKHWTDISNDYFLDNIFRKQV